MEMRRTLTLLLSLTALAVAGVHIAAAHTSRSSSSVLTGVVIVNTNLAYQDGAAAGTGMVLTSSGQVLTNNHVIRGATTIHVLVPGTGRTYAARVVGYDPSQDVALLQLKNASGLSTVSIGNSSTIDSGQSVTAVGNAGGTGKLTVTTGSITGLDRSITVNDEQGGTAQLQHLIETNAGLQPGDSGGPLLDSLHRVIGMDSAASSGFYFQQGSSEGFAIPIGTATSIAKQIAAGTSSAHVHIGATGFLGVQIDPSGYYRGGSFNAGVIVTGVVPGSPVAKAGIVSGDVITSVDGHAVASQTALVALILPHHPGDKVVLKWVDQSGSSHSGAVVLASGPPQ
jgi:S1-C subfamily serine protease